MRKIFLILILCCLFFVLEFLLFNLFGKWFKPDLLLLLVIFFNLYLGIRYSLLAAFFSGILKDSFSVDVFGIHILTFMICAVSTTLIKRNLFHTGPSTLRFLLAFFISLLNVFIAYFLHSMFVNMEMGEMIRSVLLPEVVLTTWSANFVLRHLKQCVLKFSV